MHTFWCWIVANSEAITATAAFLGMLFTAAYLVATILIFRQTKKSVIAAEKSATAAVDAVQAGKENANAAKQSASAAQSSAGAAAQTVALMREDRFEQEKGRWSIVQTAIDSAVSVIDHLRSQQIGKWAVLRALPATTSLYPQSAWAAIDAAARLRFDLATKLSSAFDDLRIAFDKIDQLRHLAEITNQDALAPSAAKAEELLSSAFKKFTELRSLLPPAP